MRILFLIQDYMNWNSLTVAFKNTRSMLLLRRICSIWLMMMVGILVYLTIVDFCKDDSVAVKVEDGFKEMSNGDKVPVVTTKGWDAQVRWKDTPTNWIPLSELKEANPIEVTEAAPAFNWWVHKVLKRRDRMIGQMETHRCWRGQMKFGVQIPGTVDEGNQT